ncbi:MAG: TolC family protein [Bacteroidetes bacterium]|nr:TolC family protein [Bacteroidota bacterium]
MKQINTKRWRVKQFLILLGLPGLFTQLFAQSQEPLTLEQCYTLAKQNYPLARQRDLIAKSKEYSIDNISKGYLPQLTVAGQATYQSDVTQIPITLPGVKIAGIPKDQYKLYGEINQPVTDLITVSQQKKLQEANSLIQEQNFEVELYKLKDRINQLFFGVLMIDEQLKQNEILKKDIETGLSKITTAIKNGVDFKSNADKLKAELLKAKQRDLELQASRRAYTGMLGLFMNQALDEHAQLLKPKSLQISQTLLRPELIVFDSRNKVYDIQKKLINTKNLPKLGLFFQGGIGQPSPVNMLSRDLSSYYIGGVRLNWSLNGLYTIRKEKALIEIDRKLNDMQRDIFLFNTNFTMKQQHAEIIKLEELLKQDQDIVELRTSVKNTANTQLENGIITTNDYVKEINAEDQARQGLILHEIQLLMAQYNYQNTTGN